MSVFQIIFINIVIGSLFLHTHSDSPKKISPKKKTNLPSVMEGSTVNLNCSAEAPCPKQPPTISWSNISESANITTQLLENNDKTQSVFSYMTFNASYRDHKKNIFCTVTYPRNKSEGLTVKTNVTLHVLFPPKETHITTKPSASVSVGINVTLTCRSKGSPSKNMTYTWYKRGQERPIAHEKKFILKFTHNNTGWYSCTAQNTHGNQSAEIQLTAEGQDGFSIPMIAACIGAIVAVLMLSALGFCLRIVKKTNSGDDVGEKDSLNQARDETIDMNVTYADVLTVTNQVNKISDVQSVNTEHNTGKDLTEDNNEKGSDVVYAQVYTQHKKTEDIRDEQVIYARVKI